MRTTFDLHCHPTIKAFGYAQGDPNDAASSSNPASLWYSDKVNALEAKIEGKAGLPLFRQSDLEKQYQGNISVSILSIGPIEQGFFDVKNKLLDVVAGNNLANTISGVGLTRVKQIRSRDFNYWEDFKKEYQYLLNWENKQANPNSKIYALLRKGEDLDKMIGLNPPGDILLGLSAEGCHLFCNGNETHKPEGWIGLEERVMELKSWPVPVLFVSIAHHFYNGLCSHAESLFGKINDLIDGQHYGRSTLVPHISPTEITDNGRKLIDLLYSKENGYRILIDIKHFSTKAKDEFYTLRKDHGYQTIPIIASHAGCRIFYNEEVNLRNEDILEIINSDGIIGLELDERIMGAENPYDRQECQELDSPLKEAKYADAMPIWNNLIYIAELAHKNGKSDPWKYICLGSDYDGVINAFNKYLTAAQIQKLWPDLEEILTYYFSLPDADIKPKPDESPASIIQRIAYANLLDFLKRNFPV